MIDLGISKIAMIGAVALIVIGPDKLPRVARTVGALLGKAQRYVADVKAEVNRSMDLDELKKGCHIDSCGRLGIYHWWGLEQLTEHGTQAEQHVHKYFRFLFFFSFLFFSYGFRRSRR